MIVNFLNPFDSRKADATKRVFLQHLYFVGSFASRHRQLSEMGKGKIILAAATGRCWRSGSSPAAADGLKAEEDLRA